MTDLVEERPRALSLRILLEAAVVVVFLLLIWNNYTLRRQQSGAAATRPATHRGFVPRDMLAQVPVTGLDGTRGTLDLQHRRGVVAIVDPRCDSCRELIATMRGASGVSVISLAPAEPTRAMAQEAGLLASTHLLAGPLPEAVEAQMHIYPQLFVVDRGRVMRTCATLAECR